MDNSNAEVQNFDSAGAGEPVQTNQNRTSDSVPDYSGRKKRLTVVAVILLGLVAGGAAYYFIRNKPMEYEGYPVAYPVDRQ